MLPGATGLQAVVHRAADANRCDAGHAASGASGNRADSDFGRDRSGYPPLRRDALADAIGLADGIHVARINNGTWSITARGFAEVAANKMLIMIDGRTMYSPLVLRDVGMPREDGYELIRQQRSRQTVSGGGMPAVAATAYASENDRAAAIASGYQAHVAKPFEPEELARIEASLRGAQIRPS